MPFRFAIKVAYDGTGYAGWQRQADEDTIQERLERALSEICREEIVIHGAGRTDAGVHAYGQVAHFDLSKRLPKNALTKGVNSLLPYDIRIRDVFEVSQDFHARKSAEYKIYSYYFLTSHTPDPLLYRFSLHVPGGMDVEAMKTAADMLVGEHDFASFQGSGSEVLSTVRTVKFIRFKKIRPFLWRMDICADGFLKHMVRNIVGTLLEVSMGKISPEDIAAILDSRDRSAAGPTASARGLLLRKVVYQKDQRYGRK